MSVTTSPSLEVRVRHAARLITINPFLRAIRRSRSPNVSAANPRRANSRFRLEHFFAQRCQHHCAPTTFAAIRPQLQQYITDRRGRRIPLSHREIKLVIERKQFVVNGRARRFGRIP